LREIIKRGKVLFENDGDNDTDGEKLRRNEREIKEK
jgi:hypothetical protein